MEIQTTETELVKEIEQRLQGIPVAKKVAITMEIAALMVENAAYDSAGMIHTTTVSRMISLSHELSQVSRTLHLRDASPSES